MSNLQWLVYPPSEQVYNANDYVYIRSKSKKDLGRKGYVIKEWKMGEGRNNDNHRIEVKILKNDSFLLQEEKATLHNKKKDLHYTVSFRPVRIVPIVDTAKDSKIIVVETTTQYRKLAASQLVPNDHVLEIGCSNGECSLVIDKYLQNGRLIGFDVSQEMVNRTKEKFRTKSDSSSNAVEFYTIDPFADSKNAFKLATKARTLVQSDRETVQNMDECEIKPTVVFIDIGGNRELNPVLRMISWARKSFSSRLFIVKSEELWKSIHEHQKESSTEEQLSKRPKKEKVLVSIGGSGVVTHGEEWFQSTLEKMVIEEPSSQDQSMPKTCTKCPHPLKAPNALSPVDNKTPICRYHNYHEKGCRKGADCPFDHSFCHWCFKPGHRALIHFELK